MDFLKAKCVQCLELREVCQCTPHKVCKCGMEMWFVWTKTGKRMPVKADGTTHFADCPHAMTYRRQVKARARRETKTRANRIGTN